MYRVERTLGRPASFLAAWAAVLTLLFCGTPRAEAAPAATAKVGTLARIMTARASSLAELESFAKSINVDLPPFLTAAGIGQQFPFIGPQGMDPSRPVSIEMYAGPNMDIVRGQGVVFVLPVKPGIATLKDFIAQGGKPVVGHPDVVDLGGMGFKRTANELVFGQPVNAVLAVKESAPKPKAPGAGASAGALIRVTVDLEAVRTAMPEQYQAGLDQIKAGTAAPQDANQKAGQEMALKFFNDLRRVDLSLTRGAANVELALSVDPGPSQVSAGGTFPKPGMPADVVMRLDLGAPPTSLMASDEFVKKLLADESKDDSLKKDQFQAMNKLLEQVRTMLADVQAMSVGIAPQGKEAIGYVVAQSSQPPDLLAQLKAFAAQFNKTSAVMDDKAKGEKSSMKVEQYSEAGQKVVRLTVTDRDKPQGYVDATAKGNLVYMTISPEPGHHLASLMTLPPQGQISGLLHGMIDLGGVLKAMQNSPENPLAKMPADQRRNVYDLLKNRQLAFAATMEGEAIRFSIAVPEGLIKDSVKLVKQIASGAPAEAPEAK